ACTVRGSSGYSPATPRIPSVPKSSFPIYCFLAGGAAGLAAGVAGLGEAGAGAGAALELDFGAAAGAFLSYMSTISLVISMPLAAHRTGVCCELTSIMMAKPL